MREIKFRAWDGEKMINNCVIKNGKYVEYSKDDDFYTFAEFDFNIMQFTGILDKNGKEIYEGDIVKNKSGGSYVIEWNEKDAQFCISILHNLTKSLFRIYPEENEIIGNIYENSELLDNKN